MKDWRDNKLNRRNPMPNNENQTAGQPPKRELSMMAWLATEGGRKCPQCGRFAKADELGYTGGSYNIGGVLTHISSYGHLPGYGCNRSQNDTIYPQ